MKKSIIIKIAICSLVAINALEMNAMFRAVRSSSPATAGRRLQSYDPKARVALRERKEELTILKTRKSKLSQILADMERDEAYEMANYSAFKARSNAGIRSGAMRRIKLELENIEAKMSKKAPSQQDVLRLEREKQELEERVEQLKREEDYLRQTNPWKLSVDHEFVIGARKNAEMELNTINTLLKKRAKLVERRESRKRITAASE